MGKFLGTRTNLQTGEVFEIRSRSMKEKEELHRQRAKGNELSTRSPHAPDKQQAWSQGYIAAKNEERRIAAYKKATPEERDEYKALSSKQRREYKLSDKAALAELKQKQRQEREDFKNKWRAKKS